MRARALLSLLSLLVAIPALAAESWILTPATGDSAAADLVRTVPGVLSVEPVFDRSEQSYLVSAGEAMLAQSLKLSLVDEAAASRVRDRLKQAGAGYVLERNSLAFGMEALEELQWGVRNQGAPQKLALDDLTTLPVQGRSGEDVGISRVPRERPAGRKVIVAVLDTGMDSSHTDLVHQTARKPGECQALAEYQACLKTGPQAECDKKYATTDTDGNGYPLDCQGWNVTAGRNPLTGIFGNSDASDDVGHGTHVSGIVGAALNGAGVRGVAENVLLLPVKVIKSSPNAPIRPQSADEPVPSPQEKDLKWAAGFADIIARGVLYSIRSGAQVINLSLAWPAGVDSLVMRKMVKLAQSRGILFVAAAGNDSADSRVMPCQYPGVVCVASHNPDGSLSHFSNYGSFVDVAAPGLWVLSTWPMNKRATQFTALTGYEYKNGTSMAAPMVAGVLARLLLEGYDAAEAFARLLVGTRPVQAALDPRLLPTAMPAKTIRTGNVDLARSLGAHPVPLILPEIKDAVRLGWNRADRKLPFTLKLKNFWARGTAVHVSLKVAPPADGKLSQQAVDRTAALAESEFLFDAWEAGSTQVLSSSLEILDPSVDGKLTLELTVHAKELAEPRVLRVPLELSVAIAPGFADPEARVFPIEGGEVAEGSLIRTVTAVDGRPGQDYLAIEDQGFEVGLTLLREMSGKAYQVAGQTSQKAVEGELLLVQRLDLYQNGGTQYALIYRMPPPKEGARPMFKFVFFDGKLDPIENATIDFDNTISVLSERFQWLKIGSGADARLAPAWISVGTTPELDKPGFDPWNPDPIDPPALHFYYLSPKGLRMVKEPKGYFFIQMLAQTDEQRAHGEVPVLLAKGDDYRLEYASALIRDGAVAEPVALKLERYRMLNALTPVGSLTSLTPGIARTGSAFAGQSSRGTQRVTSLMAAEAGAFVSGVDFVLKPGILTDAVRVVIGVYTGGERQAVFGQTNYQLLYQDLVSGQTASIGLNRFSFLPAFIFGRSFFPITVERAQSSGGERFPAVLVPDTSGLIDNMEVVVPRYSGTQLEGLARPARLRFTTMRGCDLIGNPIAATAQEPTQVAFFCGDHLIRVPLRD